MELIITLRKEVADQAEAEQLFELVKEKLAGQPEITVTGQTSEKIVTDEPT